MRRTDVYADLLFVINFCMDYSCLAITSKAASCPFSPLRGAVAASIGAVYSVLSLFVSSPSLSLALALFVCVSMCAIAFARVGDKISRIVKISAVYFGVSSLSGGCVSVVFFLLERFGEFALTEPFSQMGENPLSRAVCVSLSLGCLMTYSVLCVIKKARVDKAVYINVFAFGASIELPIVADSGNTLRDPLCGKPCTVISEKDLCLLLGEEKAHRLSRGLLDGSDGERICVIPTRTVNRSSVLYGFYPTRAVLLDSSHKLIKNVDTVIAISTDLDGGKAILPQALI